MISAHEQFASWDESAAFFWLWALRTTNYPLTEWIKYWGPGNNHVLLRV